MRAEILDGESGIAVRECLTPLHEQIRKMTAKQAVNEVLHNPSPRGGPLAVAKLGQDVLWQMLCDIVIQGSSVRAVVHKHRDELKAARISQRAAENGLGKLRAQYAAIESRHYETMVEHAQLTEVSAVPGMAVAMVQQKTLGTVLRMLSTIEEQSPSSQHVVARFIEGINHGSLTIARVEKLAAQTEAIRRELAGVIDEAEESGHDLTPDDWRDLAMAFAQGNPEAVENVRRRIKGRA